MQPAIRRLLLLGGVAAIAIPAIAQVQNATAPTAPAAPVAAAPATTQQPAQATADQAQSLEGGVSASASDGNEVVAEAPPPPVEYPSFARRDPFTAGALDIAQLPFGAHAWGQANGAFLSSLMRRMDTPIASRWVHIGLRDALLAQATAPPGVNPVDFAAERAWLLLRLGEADGSRMLIASVDTDRFTPKMTQVAVQSALANSDPLGLCPLTDGMRKVEPRIFPLAQAICAGLNGEPEAAAADVEAVRRRGPIGGIDLSLAQKVVGATSDSGTSATIEWEPVDALTSWRYGLATATALSPPNG